MARASLQHQSYSNSLAAAAESGHDLRLSYDRDSPEQKIDPRQAGECASIFSLQKEGLRRPAENTRQ
jgi:hypothetical protein